MLDLFRSCAILFNFATFSILPARFIACLSYLCVALFVVVLLCLCVLLFVLFVHLLVSRFLGLLGVLCKPLM